MRLVNEEEMGYFPERGTDGGKEIRDVILNIK